MKTKLYYPVTLLILALFVPRGSEAQTWLTDSRGSDDIVYLPYELDKKPGYPGGQTELNKFLEKELNYPLSARENAIEGKVRVRFIVGPDGEILEPRIIKSPGYGCDEEVLRIIRQMPSWSGGRRENTTVFSYVEMSVQFQLSV